MAHASTPQSLPEAAYALAAKYDLSTPLARYQHRVSKDVWVFAGIAPVVGGFLLLNPFDITRAGFCEPITVLLCAGFLSVSLSALGEVVRHLFYRRSTILVCTAGLLQVSGSTHEVVRWEEVESVVQVPPGNWGKYGFGGPLLDIEPACIMRRTYGMKLTCKVGRSQTKHLGEMVARATAPYLLPRALAAYQDGWPVVFGPLRLTQQGISRGNTFLPWSQHRGYLLRPLRPRSAGAFLALLPRFPSHFRAGGLLCHSAWTFGQTLSVSGDAEAARHVLPRTRALSWLARMRGRRPGSRPSQPAAYRWRAHEGRNSGGSR